MTSSLLQRIDDRLHPVLVKEVRQSLRGRMFSVAFLVALGLATALSVPIVTNLDPGNGARALMPIFAVLLVALLVYVPMHAMQAMRQEESESARDLLVLTPLGVWRVVIGKLLASLVVCLLVLSAFGPFIVVLAMQPGVDTFHVLAFLFQAVGVSVFLIALGVAAGAAQANRLGRGVGTTVLALVLMLTLGFEINWLERVMRGRLRDSLAPIAVAWLWVAVAAPMVLGFAAAALARDDREVSGGLRRAWALLVIAAVINVTLTMPFNGASCEDIGFAAILTVFVGTFVAAFICSERDHLDGPARRHLQDRRGVRRGAILLMSPGGERGVALSLMLGGVLIAASTLGVSMARNGTLAGVTRGRRIEPEVMLFVGAVAVGASLAFAIVPSHLLGARQGTAAQRRRARWITTLSLLGISIFMPFLLLISTGGDVGTGVMSLCPPVAFVQALDGGSSILSAFDKTEGVFLLWTAIAILGYALALPAARRGLTAGRPKPAR